MRKEKGITLMALVIIIIVLLILAGITINLTIRQDGIITKAQQASQEMKKAEIREDIKLKILEQQAKGIKISKSNLQAMLSIYGTVIEENGQVISVMLENGSQIEIKQIYADTIIEDNVTYIYTKGQLEAFRDNVNNGKTYENETVMLMSNIDLKGNAEDENTWWNPIGRSEKKFQGIFDGNNYEIQNIYTNYKEEFGGWIGLFATTSGNAIIKNLTLTGEIRSDYYNVQMGGFVAKPTGNLLLLNCKNKANVKKNIDTGNCAIGGFIGSNGASLIMYNCVNLGEVFGSDFKGGLIGICEHDATANTKIYNCYNVGKVSGGYGKGTGGLIGAVNNSYNNVEIYNSYNIAEVYGKNAGGIIGYVFSNKNVTIENSYNFGNITAIEGTYEGGIIGNNEGIVQYKNVYFLAETSEYGIGNTSNEEGKITQFTEEVINKFNQYVDTKKNIAETIANETINIRLSYWKLSEATYPIFE